MRNPPVGHCICLVQRSISRREFKMKMHVLTATVLAALASQAVLAASEGGDTWSSLQAQGETTVQQASIQNRPGRTDSEYAGETDGSEGGDTWSRFVPPPQGQPTGSARLASAPLFE